MANFFIQRPVFAWVLAIILMIAGGLAILKLPVAQYPTIAPPAVAITATYPGADAQTVQDTVTQVDYALALTQAVKGGTLPANVAKELTGLLHDMVWLLSEFVKEPRITAH